MMDGTCTQLGSGDAAVPGYQIPLAEAFRHLPRRVGPWIDADEFIDGTDAPPILPPPPPALRALHDQPRMKALVQLLDERLRAAIERPAVVHPHSQPGRRAVVVLFSAVVEFDGPRILETYLVPNDESIPRWTESTLPAYADTLPLHQFSLDPSPYLDLWLDRYLAVVEFWLSTPVISEPDAAPAYLAWLRNQMLRRHWTPPVRRRVRAAVQAAYALNPQALALARRIRLQVDQSAAVTADRYAFALAELRALREVKRLAPGLLPLYALVARDLATWLEPLAALRHWVLQDARLAPRHWRWLQRHGTRWLWRLMRGLQQVTPADVRDLLALACDFGFEGRASTPLLMAVAHLSATANRPAASASDWSLERLVQPLGRWWNRCAPEDRPALEQLAPALAEWLYGCCRDADLPRLMRLDWRRADDWMRADIARLSLEWSSQQPVVRPVALDAVRHGALRVRGLDSPAALWEEGQAMRHCADRFLPVLRWGRHRMLSIFHARTGRRVATLLVRRTPEGWRVDRIAGFANREVSPAVREMARRVCEALDRLAPRQAPPA